MSDHDDDTPTADDLEHLVRSLTMDGLPLGGDVDPSAITANTA